jgi:hypothetical protein
VRRLRVILFALVLVGAGLTPALAQDEPRVSFSTSVNYSVGDYGSGQDTTLLYVPFTLGVRPLGQLWLELTVPYIYLSNQNVVVTGGGVAVRNDKVHGKLARPAQSTSESGVGDVLVKASYVVVEEGEIVPEIRPYLKIKFPTADADRGLGTGEYDETLGVDVSKRLVGSLFGFVTAAYTFIGDPPGTDLHDSFGWSVGAAYAVTTPLTVFAFLDGATAVSPGEDDPLELRVGAEYRLTRNVKFTGSVVRGLTNGSPDWGLSAGLSLKF